MLTLKKVWFRRCVLWVVLGCWAPGGDVQGQWTFREKLSAANPENGDYFGSAVALCGDFALIGAPHGDAWDYGEAYIYRYDSVNWLPQQTLTPDPLRSGRFGVAVDLSSDYAVVGTSYVGQNTGEVYVFKRGGEPSNPTWTQEAILQGSQADPHSGFGTTVAIDGDYIIVGSPDEWVPIAGGGDCRCGAAYIFHREGSTWLEQARLLPSIHTMSFGGSVAIQGDLALVGGPEGADNAPGGAAYLFARQGISVWPQVAQFKASDGAAEDHFGARVALDGDYLAVAALQRVGGVCFNGALYMFEKPPSGWDDATETAKLTPPGGPTCPASSLAFGWSVAISGARVLIGAPEKNGTVPAEGAAYIFERQGGVWSLADNLDAPEATVGQYFGGSLALDGARALVGAYFADVLPVTGCGAAYVFEGPRRLFLLAPNGGEHLRAGSVCATPITWTSIGDIPNVLLQYSFDNGLHWNLIDTMPNTGVYPWRLPYKESPEYLARVVDAVDPSVSDTSSAVFQVSICPLTADLNCDCCVNWQDFCILAGQWLQCAP